MEARRFFLVLVALLSPLEQARGFNPPCNVRRGESTAAVIKLHSRRHVHDADSYYSRPQDDDGNMSAGDERSTAPPPPPPPPSSSSSAKTSRRKLVSDTLLLGAAAAAGAGAGAILAARPSQAAPRERGQASSSGASGDAMAMALALPAVGPRTKRIFLARHGQTDLNKLEVCQGRRLNPPLNERGRGQARALLAGTELSAILCSPLRRARETAGIVRESHPQTARFSVSEDLNEVDFGGAEGLPKLLAAAVLAPAYFSWSKGNGQGLGRRAGRFGESGVALRRRAEAAAGALLASCEEGGQVLGVSHSSMIKFTLATLLDVPLGTIRTLGQDNCAVNALDFDAASGAFEAVVVNGAPARGRAARFGRVGAGAWRE